MRIDGVTNLHRIIWTAHLAENTLTGQGGLTAREIKFWTGLSLNTIYKHLHYAVDNGYMIGVQFVHAKHVNACKYLPTREWEQAYLDWSRYKFARHNELPF